MRAGAWVSLYAVAMAAVESAVVVYLRALHPGPAPVTVLLNVIPARLITIEIGREAATLVMLLAVATLAGRGEGRWPRFLYFCLAFGIWDIFYYIWLWVFIGWPPSLLTWDVLFLIPVPWLGPVLAPIIVSAGLVAGSLVLLGRHAHGAAPGFPWGVWAALVVGAVVVVLSFTLDYRFALQRADPPSFRWGLFGSGIALAAAAVLAATRRKQTAQPGAYTG